MLDALANSTTTSRFGSALADLLILKDSPFLGYGRRYESIYGTSKWSMKMHRNNGLTGTLVRLGLIFGLFYFILLFYSFKKYIQFFNGNKLMLLVVFAVIILLGFSQRMFSKPLLVLLMFLYIPFSQKQTINEGK